jgi:GxxExxY protein
MDSLLPTIITNIITELGSGYKEHIYQRAIEIEFQKENIIFHSEVICPVMYSGIQVGFERADIVTYSIDRKVPLCVLELKSQVSSITKKEFIQLSKYFKGLNLSEGYIINFMITPDIFILPECNKLKYVELFKLNLNYETAIPLKIMKYSFLSGEFKDYKT